MLFLSAARLWAADPSEDLNSLDRHFARELEILAIRCDTLGLTEQAKITREWQTRRTKGRTLLFLPPVVRGNDLPKEASDLVQKWHVKFHALRQEQASGLTKLAVSLASAKEADPATAYRLLHEALREDPDNRAARNALGHRRNATDNAWEAYSPPPTISAGKTPHPKTGWQQGKYWRVDSKHWRIATNQSGAAGVELAKKLEDFHWLWKQTFFEFWSSRAELEQGITNQRPLPEPGIQLNVLLFRTRDEYVKYLSSQPNIGLTQGFYSDAQQTSIFFVGDETVQPTWFHEAAHQLFQQWRGTPQGVGEKQNFWMVEGAAMHVESLQNHGSHWTVGGWQADRLQIPRYRVLNGDKGLPLQQLVALGRDQVQSSADIRKIYSQSAATAHFLFDHESPMYRSAGGTLLREIYRQNDQRTSLAQLTGASFEELDAGYLKSLQVTDDDLLTTPGLARLRNLALGRTQVTAKGLAALTVCSELRWLELSGLPVDDAAFANFKNCTKLDQLFLDGTQLTDKSLPLIATFTNLEELDLSNTKLTDEAVPALSKLRKLKTLHVTGSGITAAGVQKLKAAILKLEIQN
ncbi:leucine-rich repeat domain-containing protein [Anatilimnocola floriformis]|uniref:leucine-rich repeat domain-containing protein n=1 Tax=Anatilimnocola floriformis TaxID=2948575 RepID=UPI0020C2768F|nr:hypothetical protein [Anatilimnocola floriformis]